MNEENVSSSTVTRVVRLEIFPKVKGETKESVDAKFERLDQLFDESRRAANLIVNGQYINDRFARMHYARLKIDPSELYDIEKRTKEIGEKIKDSKSKEEKESLREERKELRKKVDEIKKGIEIVEKTMEDMFGTKRQATTERDIKSEFPDLPSVITNPLNQAVVGAYRNSKRDVMSGNVSLASYKKNMPIPVRKESLKFRNDGEYHELVWNLGSSGEEFHFGIVYGRDKAGNRTTVQQVIDSKKSYFTSQFQRKKGKLYLLLNVKESKVHADIDPNITVGMDIGIRSPVVITLDEKRYNFIGDKDSFLRVRIQMQRRSRLLHRNISSARGGHGRKRKLRALNSLEQKERNYSRQYNQFLSKRSIDYALSVRAGNINMEFLEGFGQDGTKEFVLRNWSYFELQTLVSSGASKYGIKVNRVDPYHTSQTCSKCGHYESGQREGENFKCKKCGLEMNSDLNAAINIAKSRRFVTRKEECQYWIEKKAREGNKVENPEVKNVLSDRCCQINSQPEQPRVARADGARVIA